ncbi:hypothetical protein HJG60_009299 [Phyllostomus discolor]|uniref:Uncharacterized protein n=1 Tax=Phyllostomus discolor TaxID=89673 RepID=A0A834DCK3_9CHIR|nr:hypothetical protein HJG60_009299 [Phyllostomus discolor]
MTSCLHPVTLRGSTEGMCTDGYGGLAPVCEEFWRIEEVSKRLEVKIGGSSVSEEGNVSEIFKTPSWGPLPHPTPSGRLQKKSGSSGASWGWPAPGYSSVGITWETVELPRISAHSRPANYNLHFNKIHR